MKTHRYTLSSVLFAFLTVAQIASTLPTLSVSPFSSSEAVTTLTKNGYRIHPSCGGDKSTELAASLDELKTVARLASSYLKSHVPEDELIVRYFGKGADKSIPIATFTSIMKGSDPMPVFRCDDIDGKCAANREWNGHWRDEQGENETVICDLSFRSRLDLNNLCAANVTSINQYWALDLMHRALHLPSIAQGRANHTVDGYKEVLQLAKDDPSRAVANTVSLQTFAFDVVSREYNPPNGCLNEAM